MGGARAEHGDRVNHCQRVSQRGRKSEHDSVVGWVPQEGRGSGFIDGLRALVQSSCTRWMVVRRGAKKML